MASKINSLPMPYYKSNVSFNVVYKGFPINILLDKILDLLSWETFDKVEAYATGKLATSEYGNKQVFIEGKAITSAKSDVIIVAYHSNEKRVVGVSVKQCNNNTPTNAQVFFTTATAFYNLVKSNGIPITDHALKAMRQFCGDFGFRPLDDIDCSERVSTPERYFWEEIDERGKKRMGEYFHKLPG